MPTFRYAKLVRDNIADFHIDSGHTLDMIELTGKPLVDALCVKLHEEADEIAGASTQKDIIEEIADMQQVIDDLCEARGITSQEIAVAQEKKAARKGGFRRGIYIETVHMPNEDDEWVAYCRQSPEKYVEIDSDDTLHILKSNPTVRTGPYRHNKTGHIYEVIGTALQTETDKLLVIYRRVVQKDEQPSDHELFARPADMFTEQVIVHGKQQQRFEKISD